MHSLSPLDGSADAVRAADDAGSNAVPRSLERELDRVAAALNAQLMTASQHINWMMLAQSLLLLSYLLVLIAGWSLPLPGKRWLLASIAGFAAAALVLAVIGMRSQLGRTGALRSRLRATEEALERISGRPPVLSKGSIASAFGRTALGALPTLVIAAWGALMLYALALPMPTDLRVASDGRDRAAISEARPKASAARNTPQPRDAPAPAAETAPMATESPLSSFLRRATQAAQGSEPANEVDVKP